MRQERKKEAGSKWISLKRCLLIVQRLQQGSATKSDLVRAVREWMPDAYNAATDKASRKRFEEDMRRIRAELDVAITYDRKAEEYRLIEMGPYLSIELSPETLRGLAFLLTTFDEESAANELVYPLLETIQQRLGEDQTRQLVWQSPELEIDLRNLDKDEINPEVWAKVRQARRRRVTVKFDYVADPPMVVTHIVEPHYLQLKDGHYILQAYCRCWVSPKETRNDVGWLDYRLSRIQPGLELLPDKFAARSKKLITIKYRLSPQIHRQGKVTARFIETEVSSVEKDGWVTVTGKTDSLFRARRILLGYGQNCQVIAPPELQQQFFKAAKAMAKIYKIN